MIKEGETLGSGNSVLGFLVLANRSSAARKYSHIENE